MTRFGTKRIGALALAVAGVTAIAACSSSSSSSGSASPTSTAGGDDAARLRRGDPGRRDAQRDGRLDHLRRSWRPTRRTGSCPSVTAAYNSVYNVYTLRVGDVAADCTTPRRAPPRPSTRR